MRARLVLSLWIAGCGSSSPAPPGDDLSMPLDLSTGADLAMPDLAANDLATVPPDLAAADLSAIDLAMPSGDLSSPADLSSLPGDLATPLDFAAPLDFAPPLDLTPPPDLSPVLDLAPPLDLTWAPPDGAPLLLDSGMCNTLANSSAFIPETNVPANLPPPTGGTIPLGRWELTAWENFTGLGGASGPTGNQRKTAFYFEPTVYYKVTADFGSVDTNYSRTWSTAGTTLTSNQFCPDTNFLTSFYSVVGTTLTLQAGSTRYTYQLK